MDVTEANIAAGAQRYAAEAARLARRGFGRGFHEGALGTVPREVYNAMLAQFGEAYAAMMIDAYTTGAHEALKMARGDFTPEPWTG
jgi:hypothetical protein